MAVVVVVVMAVVVGGGCVFGDVRGRNDGDCIKTLTNLADIG